MSTFPPCVCYWRLSTPIGGCLCQSSSALGAALVWFAGCRVSGGRRCWRHWTIWWQEMASKDVLFGLEISLHGIVIVEKTQISDQYFPAAQKFIVLELGMTLLPVANQGEASQLIIQLVHEQSKDHTSNPFLHKKCPQLVEASILRTVQQIPGVGKTKALLLLQQFPVIKEPAFPVFPQTALREASCGQKTGLLLLESAEMQIKSQSLISFRLRNTLS
ncbi:Fanconi anemia core complex-associated protein 24 isoform X3 [Chelonia mydas]|uniref:Fanconi anemia core complex-associated protein 24 isoform X3 n=1 Tax=Chelonia mydas TaxID=8469 RepID=UPI001CA932EA|nr:Fanconi anemia core complex-associated protein 24 isoform X3 [Chelonia mydas]